MQTVCPWAFLPNAVEDIAVGEYSNISVVDKYPVKMASFFIAEKSVGHPNFLWIRQGQIIEHPIIVVEFETAVVPLLTKCNLNSVFLEIKEQVEKNLSELGPTKQQYPV